MKFIIAYQRRFAEYAAQEIELRPTQWTWISDDYRLRGLCNQEFILVDAQRYEPTGRELDVRNAIEQALHFLHNCTVRNFTLP